MIRLWKRRKTFEKSVKMKRIWKNLTFWLKLNINLWQPVNLQVSRKKKPTSSPKTRVNMQKRFLSFVSVKRNLQLACIRQESPVNTVFKRPASFSVVCFAQRLYFCCKRITIKKIRTIIRNASYRNLSSTFCLIIRFKKWRKKTETDLEKLEPMAFSCTR